MTPARTSLFAILYIGTASGTSALNRTTFVAGNMTNTNDGTHPKMQNISNLTTSSQQDALNRSDKVGRPINYPSLQGFSALEELVNETIIPSINWLR